MSLSASGFRCQRCGLGKHVAPRARRHVASHSLARVPDNGDEARRLGSRAEVHCTASGCTCIDAGPAAAALANAAEVTLGEMFGLEMSGVPSRCSMSRGLPRDVREEVFWRDFSQQQRVLLENWMKERGQANKRGSEALVSRTASLPRKNPR